MKNAKLAKKSQLKFEIKCSYCCKEVKINSSCTQKNQTVVLKNFKKIEK
jgi:hypothetical protein